MICRPTTRVRCAPLFVSSLTESETGETITTVHGRLVRLLCNFVTCESIEIGDGIMTVKHLVLAGCLLCAVTGGVTAAEISGEYLEARSCDVWTGPCFANGEIGLSGKEAVMAWKVDQGSWNGVKLDNLSAVLVIVGEDTLGFGGTFTVRPDPIESVILVDKNANSQQREALIAFVKDSAKNLTKHVKQVESTEIQLTNDHVEGVGMLKAGDLAAIETRELKDGDCICTNEGIFYPPLAQVENFHPVYTKQMSFTGEGLNNTWNLLGKRSAFLATFKK